MYLHSSLFLLIPTPPNWTSELPVVGVWGSPHKGKSAHRVESWFCPFIGPEALNNFSEPQSTK